MASTTATAKMIVANPLRLVRQFAVQNGRRKNFDDMPFNGVNHAALVEQKYNQPWTIYDSCVVQFLSNFETHEAGIYNCQEELVSDLTGLISKHKAYRNLKYRASCKGTSLAGFLFVFFDEGVTYEDEDFTTTVDEYNYGGSLPESDFGLLNVQVGDVVRVKIDVLHLQFETAVVTEIAYNPEHKAMGYKLDIPVDMEPEDGLIEIIYNHKEHDLYAIPVSFSLDPGRYFLRLTCNLGGASEIFETETLLVEEDSEKSVLLEYMHTGIYDREDAFGFVYDDLNKIRLSLTRFYQLDPSGDIEVFEADTGIPTQLRSVPFRKIRMQMTAIPNWLADKLNVILSHDTLQYSGYQYAIEEYGSSEHIEGNDTQNYEIVLRQVSNRLEIESEGVSEELMASFTPDTAGIPALGTPGNNHTLSSNITGIFEVVAKPDWVNVSVDTLSNGELLTISISENTALTSRSGTVTYRSLEFPALEASIAVTQEAAEPDEPAVDYLFVNPNALSFDGGGETKTIGVNASGTYTILISSGFTYEKISETEIEVTALLNDSGSTLTGSITFILDDDNNITAQVDLSQEAIAAVNSATPGIVNKSVAAGSVTVEIDADPGCQWQVIKSSGISWFSVSQTSGTGSDDIRLIFESNYGGGQRTATITIRNINNTSNFITVGVVQAGSSSDGGGDDELIPFPNQP